jgi:uncharacterized Fe-S cluster protein YjdI
MTERLVKYSKSDITVLWRPDKCIHSGICVKGLGKVFNPRERKWVNVDGANATEIKAQIDKCPSKALAYE